MNKNRNHVIIGTTLLRSVEGGDSSIFIFYVSESCVVICVDVNIDTTIPYRRCEKYAGIYRRGMSGDRDDAHLATIVAKSAHGKLVQPVLYTGGAQMILNLQFHSTHSSL